MPSWNQVLKEISQSKRVDAIDTVRRKYLKKLHTKTERNIIAYYSGWLQRPSFSRSASINDDDKNGLMAVVHKLNRKKGLDLILHTPGGDIAATESIVDYLFKMFGNDIRCIIPQIAMSAGTMIACSCKQIVMGKQSSIGPIDPQFNGIPAYGVLAEFKKAISEVKNDPGSLPIWQKIVEKYHPTFLGECQNAVDMSDRMVGEWLKRNMFYGRKTCDGDVRKVIESLNNHHDTLSHARHLSIDHAKSIGLNILEMESDQVLQDLILTVHHAFMHSFAQANVTKIIENHLENAVIYGGSAK